MGNITDKTLSILSSVCKQAMFNCVDNSDEQALEVQVLYPDWETLADGTTLRVGDRVNYNGVLYNVITEHQKQENWNPVDAPSLFAKVLIPEPSVIPDWEQPSSTNGYMTGDKVKHHDKIWESLVDNNVWEPDTVGTESLWKEVTE
jgi:hypothetical protein